MASPHHEQNLLTRGIVANKSLREGFAKNVFFRNGQLEVRQGFGTVAEFDTSLSHNFEDASAAVQGAYSWGYRKHLGSYTMLTDFGHTQIISVFTAKVNTGDEINNGMAATICIVSIYDVTTGDRWEEPIHRHTAENNRKRIPMPRWRGTFQSNVDRDYQDWIHVDGSDEFYFQEYRDILFFGSIEVGMLAYFPAIFNRNRRKQVDKVNEKDWQSPYSESSIIIKAIPSAGVFEEGVVYLTSSEMPNPTALTVVDNRLIYAVGRTLYFSEPGQPTNIRADNFIILSDIESDITAIAALLGNLHIFTDRETWMYHPNEGASVISLGRLNPISRSVGCSGKNAVTYRRNKIVWTDSNGVYATAGQYVIEDLSSSIDDFFKDRGLADPTSSYFTDPSSLGHTHLDTPQPKTYYHFNPDRLNMSYWHAKGLLFVTVPGEDCALVLCDNNEWCLWVFESSAYILGSDQRVRAVKNIREPWLLPYRDQLHLVEGPAESGQLLSDSSTRLGAAVNDDATLFSYSILQYGRGGALDKSSSEEDFRGGIGKYNRTIPPGQPPTSGMVYIDPWIPLKEGDEIAPGITVTANEVAFLLPVVIAPRVTALPGGVQNWLRLKLRFDSGNWTPYLWNTHEIRFILPSERLNSNGGYTAGARVAGVSEVSLYLNSSGLQDANGDEIWIYWDRAAAGVHMNLIAENRNQLMYIPMKLKANPLLSDLASMGLDITYAQHSDGIFTNDMVPCIWEQSTIQPASTFKENRRAQAVDWVYKTMNLDPDQSDQISAKGLIMQVESHGDGRASEALSRWWRQGVLNVMAEKDGAIWQAQRIDFWDDNASSISPAVTQNTTDLPTVKQSFKDILDGSNIQYPIFDNGIIQWQDEAVEFPAVDGAYLIADPVVHDLMTSDSVRGRSISYMLLGYMRHRAHRLIFNRIQGRVVVSQSGPHRSHSADGGGPAGNVTLLPLYR